MSSLDESLRWQNNWKVFWHRLFVKFQSCDAKELLTYCEGFILKNLPAMMDIKNFRDNLFNNNSQDVSTCCSKTYFTVDVMIIPWDWEPTKRAQEFLGYGAQTTTFSYFWSACFPKQNM